MWLQKDSLATCRNSWFCMLEHVLNQLNIILCSVVPEKLLNHTWECHPFDFLSSHFQIFEPFFIDDVYDLLTNKNLP